MNYDAPNGMIEEQVVQFAASQKKKPSTNTRKRGNSVKFTETEDTEANLIDKLLDFNVEEIINSVKNRNKYQPLDPVFLEDLDKIKRESKEADAALNLSPSKCNEGELLLKFAYVARGAMLSVAN